MRRFIASLTFAVAPLVQGADLVSVQTLTLDGAKSVAATAIAQARSVQAPGGAIAIVDAAGIVIYLERLDGTFPNASDISVGKARTAALFAKPTRVFEDTVNNGRYAMLDVPAVAPFTPLKGGVPISIGGRVVGRPEGRSRDRQEHGRKGEAETRHGPECVTGMVN